jgi:Flp pilus assembly protein TadD
MTTSNSTPDSRTLLIRGTVALLLALVAFGVFAGTLGNGFVYDDELYLTLNSLMHEGFTWTTVKRAWTSFYAFNWHPLTWYSHLLDIEFFGLDPVGHHAVNVALHAANSAILFLVLSAMTGMIGRSAFASALFALHPLRVESVAWVAERKDLLSVFFGLLAIIAYHRYAMRPSARRYLTLVLLFGAALLAKPMLVTLPLLLLLLDYWPLGRIIGTAGPGRWSQRGLNPVTFAGAVVEKLPLLLLSAASSAITMVAQKGAMISLQVIPFPDRLANAFESVVRYIGKVFLPVDLAAFYPYTHKTIASVTVILSILLVAGISLLTVRLARRFPHAPVGWLWFLFALLPVIGLIQVGEQSMADRYTYLPVVGLFITLTWATAEIAARLRIPAVILATAGGCCLAILAGITWKQTGYWADDATLFRHAIEVTKRNQIAHYNLGVALQKQGEREGAAAEYRKAIEAKPDYVLPMVNLGVLLSGSGRAGEAEALYRRALLTDPRHAETNHNLAVLLSARGEVSGAEEGYRQAISVRPDYQIAHRNYGLLLADLGRTGEALVRFFEAARLAPRSFDDRVNLAAALANLGRYRESAEQYRAAIEINPYDEGVKRDLERVVELARGAGKDGG